MLGGVGWGWGWGERRRGKGGRGGEDRYIHCTADVFETAMEHAEEKQNIIILIFL